MDLEAVSRDLEDRLHRVMAVSDISLLQQNPIYKEMEVLLRRSSRSRLYLAALLGVGLRGAHSCLGFASENVQDDKQIANLAALEALKLLSQDIKRCQLIVLDNEISTANNRIGKMYLYIIVAILFN
jgi:hypothetical protein